MMSKKDLTPQQKWQKKNKNIVRKSKAEYDKKNPVWAFRPSEEMKNWLEDNRSKDKNGKPESNAAVVIRKLEKLMKLEKNNK